MLFVYSVDYNGFFAFALFGGGLALAVVFTFKEKPTTTKWWNLR